MSKDEKNEATGQEDVTLDEDDLSLLAEQHEVQLDDGTEDALDHAVSSMVDGVDALTYDGDRSRHDHHSGAPERRHLVLGDDDPRDVNLS